MYNWFIAKLLEVSSCNQSVSTVVARAANNGDLSIRLILQFLSDVEMRGLGDG